MTKLSEHFALEEFACRDGSPLPDDFAETIAPTVHYLEVVRAELNARLPADLDEGLRVLSGHRSPSYNARVGGAKLSAHVSGHAADVTPSNGFRLIGYGAFYALCDEVARRGGFADMIRLGHYPSRGFVHADCLGGQLGAMRWTG